MLLEDAAFRVSRALPASDSCLVLAVSTREAWKHVLAEDKWQRLFWILLGIMVGTETSTADNETKQAYLEEFSRAESCDCKCV